MFDKRCLNLVPKNHLAGKHPTLNLLETFLRNPFQIIFPLLLVSEKGLEQKTKMVHPMTNEFLKGLGYLHEVALTGKAWSVNPVACSVVEDNFGIFQDTYHGKKRSRVLTVQIVQM